MNYKVELKQQLPAVFRAKVKCVYGDAYAVCNAREWEEKERKWKEIV